MSHDLTTGQVASMLSQPTWRICRVVDAIGGATRFAGKRCIPRTLLPNIIQELDRRKWLPVSAEQEATT